MPVMDGIQASRQIRRFEKEYVSQLDKASKDSWRPAFIVALTGLDGADVQDAAYRSGIDTFLVKPVKRPDLKRVLQWMKE